MSHTVYSVPGVRRYCFNIPINDFIVMLGQRHRELHKYKELLTGIPGALCILWSGVMDWSLGLEPWSGALEWILGVKLRSEMLERKRNIYSGGKIGLF